MINEPNAVAFAYSSNIIQTYRNILIFDLGGSTLDVSIVNIYKGNY